MIPSILRRPWLQMLLSILMIPSLLSILMIPFLLSIRLRPMIPWHLDSR